MSALGHARTVIPEGVNSATTKNLEWLNGQGRQGAIVITLDYQ